MTKKCGCCGSTNLVKIDGDYDHDIEYFLCLDCHHIDSFFDTSSEKAQRKLDIINKRIALSKSRNTREEE